MPSTPARILFVSGKGGTGKTFVAEALAREACARGIEVALVRVHPSGLEPGEADAEEQDRPPTATGGEGDAVAKAERKAAADTRKSRTRTARTQTVQQVELDEKATLEKFVTRVVGFAFVARRLLDSRTFSAVAAAAPGLRDLITLTAITALASPRRRRSPDLVVVDAPATGHSIPLLTAPERVLEIAPAGPVAREARAARRLVADPTRFLPVIVTVPEELAVTEALSLYDDLLRIGVPSAQIVINGVWAEHLAPQYAEWLASSGASIDALLYWKRRRRQLELIDLIERRVGRCPTLPFLFREGRMPDTEIASLLDTVLDEAP